MDRQREPVNRRQILNLSRWLGLVVLFITVPAASGGCPDDDGDFICNADDNCPTVPNTGQLDADDDGIGNRCDPCRFDPGIDCSDCICPVSCTPCPGDWDCDGVAHGSDNCPCIYNPGQVDDDADGIGDSCDGCIDGDGDGDGHAEAGYPGSSCQPDNCPNSPNPSQADGDGDGIGNPCDPCQGSGPACPEPCPGVGNCFNDWECGSGVCYMDVCFPPWGCTCQPWGWSCADVCAGVCIGPGCQDPTGSDTDGDGKLDACDNCPSTPNALQQDAEGDGVGNACDNCASHPDPAQDDADGDGLGDVCDATPGVLLIGFEEPGAVLWGAIEAFDSWNLYRGDLQTLLSGGPYTQEPGSNPSPLRICGLSSPAFLDPYVPAAGSAAFYLVSGTVAGVESGLGLASDGTPRPNTYPCGLPPGRIGDGF